MFFREKISEKLKYLEISLNYLKSRRDITLEDLQSNYELRSAIERNFQVAIEAAIDVSEMIISEEGAKMPETYREAFLRLGEIGVIPRDFSTRLAQMAGFRNILVHQYSELDLNRLLEFLKTKLDYLERFSGYIKEYLRSKTGEAIQL